MATQSLSFILGIVHSKLAKHAAPHVMDEQLTKTIRPALERIEDGIEQLKLKDLKLSQDQMKSLIVRLKNKYGEESSKGCKEKLSAEIESDLKNAQNSAMAGLNSGLESPAQVGCHIALFIVLLSKQCVSKQSGNESCAKPPEQLFRYNRMFCNHWQS